MATISGGRKHTRALVTLDTERTEDLLGDGNVESIRERWVLRSDGALLSRLVSYGPVGGKQHRPSTGFRIVRKFAIKDGVTPDALRASLVRRIAAEGRATVVSPA